MKTSQKLNQVVHPLFRSYVVRRYRKKIGSVKKLHPALFQKLNKDLEKKYFDLWSPLGIRPSLDWLRYHVNLTGIQDYTFCPEDIFFSRIERILVPCQHAGFGNEDKNLLSLYAPLENQPPVLLRSMQGAFFDANYKWISESEINDLLKSNHGDLVIKDCIATSGGHFVKLSIFEKGKYTVGNTVVDSRYLKSLSSSVVIQHKVKTDSFSKSFNLASVNTCRMMTFRSPWDGKVHLLKTMLRFGVENTLMDNMMLGGLCINVSDQGLLGKYAFDYKGKKYTEHPRNGLVFHDTLHPHFHEMKRLVLGVAETMPYFHLLSFDVVPDETNKPVIIEINSTSQGITQLQFDHGGLFGTLSEKLVEWCTQNSHLDTFQHFRTFY